MIKNAINKFVKGSTNKFKITAFEKRMAIKENVMNETQSRTYNPRSARNRSLKGIVFNSK
ncbi:MAG: hypothetical protein P1U56_01920 [Saprospiraceae bacterium]|nr:hypothetical protein [Saprospiraceae bacterium]